MSAPAAPVRSLYRGFEIVVDHQDIMVKCPSDGDLAFFSTMTGVRRWVRRKRRALGMRG